MTLNLHPSVPARPAAGRQMVTSDEDSKQVCKTLDTIIYTDEQHTSQELYHNLSSTYTNETRNII